MMLMIMNKVKRTRREGLQAVQQGPRGFVVSRRSKFVKGIWKTAQNRHPLPAFRRYTSKESRFSWWLLLICYFAVTGIREIK